MTALHVACIRERCSFVKLLVEFKPELYAKDSDGYCAFHYAIKKDLVDIVDYLCKYAGLKFFDKSVVCPEGSNLHLAVYSESLNIAKHFVEKESQIQMRNQVFA
eukprot:TRINITY_DN6563_c0_g1_i1.p3 TRINITY_DN6563_c0_g1~~TRINITY_DN6563_c0_g1_i1.p3  ORF type:complete len:104 (-),score=21.77 TRINITY_DN6563_c0_g1_i1:13-324(-)